MCPRKSLSTVSSACFVVATALLLSAVPSFAQSLPEAGWLASETAADYRSRARFPAHVQALAVDAEDPIVAKRTPNPITVAAQANQGASLTVWPASIAFLAPQPAVLYARMANARGQAMRGDLQGAVLDEAGTVRAKLAFFDDGVAPDVAARDGIYTAVYRQDPRGQRQGADAPRATNLMAKISALPQGSAVAIEAVTGFQISRPGARLTGRFRDEVREGNLVIGAEVVVKRAGRYHVQATLESADGSLIGIVQAAQPLESGRTWIDLDAYGLLFTDRSQDGPFRIAAVTLTDASDMPNAIGSVLERAHTTRAYALDRFTRRSYGDPALLESARRLEADAARSLDGD